MLDAPLFIALWRAGGAVGHIHMEQIDPSTVVFQDLDDVLAIYAEERDPPMS